MSLVNRINSGVLNETELKEIDINSIVEWQRTYT